MICLHCKRDRFIKSRGLCVPCHASPVRELYPRLWCEGLPLDGKPACRHCQKRRVNRSRGLCWNCFYTPAIRDLYPPGSANPATAKFVRRCDLEDVTPDFYGRARLPDAPTTAAPGTAAKMLVMQERIAARRALFHPSDARYPGDPRPVLWMQGQGRER